MATPQTHTWITLGFIWLLKLKGWNMWGAMSFGVFIDVLDHFLSWEYVKDVFTRRLFGGDEASEPKTGIKMPKCWLHKWPILVILAVTPLITPISWGIPVLFFGIHWIIDYFQKYPSESFWDPFKKGEFLPLGGGLYPVKKSLEFKLSSFILAIQAIVFYLQWHPPW